MSARSLEENFDFIGIWKEQCTLMSIKKVKCSVTTGRSAALATTCRFLWEDFDREASSLAPYTGTLLILCGNFFSQDSSTLSMSKMGRTKSFDF